MAFVVAVYAVARMLPGEEVYGLTSQLRRAAVSIPANIAEGHERIHRGDYVHHLSVARGSLAEAETHLLLAVRLGVVTELDIEPAWALAQEVGRMLRGLVRSLERA